MSLAWSSLVVVVLLLPGLLFFAGTYLPEQFTRETENRSALGHLGGALLVSFAIHGLAYASAPWICGGWIPCIDFAIVLETIAYDSRGSTDAARIGAVLSQYRWWIFFYVLGTSGTGVLLGWQYGRLAVRGKTGGLSRHSWIRDLRVNGLTYCHVLTSVRQDSRFLLYRGFLRAFGLQTDGRFSYVVLSDVCREYLILEPEGSQATTRSQNRVMGSGSIVPPETSNGAARSGSPVQSLFVIEGENIENVVFDIYEFLDNYETDAIAAIAKEEGQRLHYPLSTALVQAIVEASASGVAFHQLWSALLGWLRSRRDSQRK